MAKALTVAAPVATPSAPVMSPEPADSNFHMAKLLGSIGRGRGAGRPAGLGLPVDGPAAPRWRFTGASHNPEPILDNLLSI